MGREKTNSANRKILIVDDQPEVLEDYVKILDPYPKKCKETEEKLASMEAELFGDPDAKAGISRRIEKEYAVATASQGEEAVSLVKKAIKEKKPFAVLFMDVRMPPGINGVEAASKIRKIDSEIEIVIVTAFSDVPRQDILKLVGPADKLLLLRKPFDGDEIKQLTLALTERWNLDKLAKKMTGEEKRSHTETIRAVAQLAEFRDIDPEGHLTRVAEYSKFIACELRKRKEPKWSNYITDQYVEDLGRSSLLHDIGKAGIADTILLKPGILTDEEFKQIKTHSAIGGQALTEADKDVEAQSFLTMAKEVAYYHHEKFDGTGYPRGLKGEEIPLSARIVAMADVYDAITSDRPYRKALPHEKAVKIITEDMGKSYFDPVILEVFVKNKTEFQKIRKQYS